MDVLEVASQHHRKTQPKISKMFEFTREGLRPHFGKRTLLRYCCYPTDVFISCLRVPETPAGANKYVPMRGENILGVHKREAYV